MVERIQLFRRGFERASWYLDRALALCPSDSELLVQLSTCEVFMGRPDVALAHVEQAMRLNPYHPSIWHGFAAFPLLLMRHADGASCPPPLSGSACCAKTVPEVLDRCGAPPKDTHPERAAGAVAYFRPASSD